MIVMRLDRLGRDTRDVLNIVHECEQRGACVTVLEPNISTKGEMGKVILTVLGMVAQMERRFIKDRQREGINRAKSSGIYKRGKARLAYQAIRTMLANGKGVTEIAGAIGCSRMQVYRVLKAST